MGRCYVKAYFDWIEQTAALSDAERGRLFTAILEYARSGLDPKLDGREGILFPAFKVTIDRDNQKSATYSENGKKGGRGNKANESKIKQIKANESLNIRHKTQDTGHKTQDEDPPTPRPDWAKAVAAYQDAITPLPPGLVTAELRDWCDVLDADVVCRAIGIAAGENKRSWQYIKAILTRYKASGLTTLAAVLADEAEKQKRKERDGYDSYCGQHPENVAKPRKREIAYDVG